MSFVSFAEDASSQGQHSVSDNASHKSGFLSPQSKHKGAAQTPTSLVKRLLKIKHQKQVQAAKIAKEKIDLENGLKFLGRHAYETKQEFNKEAETLYRGKVLIDR